MTFIFCRCRSSICSGVGSISLISSVSIVSRACKVFLNISTTSKSLAVNTGTALEQTNAAAFGSVRTSLPILLAYFVIACSTISIDKPALCVVAWFEYLFFIASINFSRRPSSIDILNLFSTLYSTISTNSLGEYCAKFNWNGKRRCRPGSQRIVVAILSR